MEAIECNYLKEKIISFKMKVFFLKRRQLFEIQTQE